MENNIIPKDLEQIDIIATANVIYNRARDLSFAVNIEILEPISAWINDPDFTKKHKVMIDVKDPDWAFYKRKQRKWTALQKQIAAERIRLYQKEIRRKRQMRQAIAGLISRSGPRAVPDIDLKAKACNALAEIVAPFSPPETLKSETQTEFKKARNRPPSSILPWNTILANSIRSNSTFANLPQYHPSGKADTVAKLQTLLQMETDQTLSLVQNEPFGEIEITCTADQTQSSEGSIGIKDQQGNTFNLKWQDLSDAQRDKVIADLINYEIICTA